MYNPLTNSSLTTVSECLEYLEYLKDRVYEDYRDWAIDILEIAEEDVPECEDALIWQLTSNTEALENLVELETYKTFWEFCYQLPDDGSLTIYSESGFEGYVEYMINEAASDWPHWLVIDREETTWNLKQDFDVIPHDGEDYYVSQY